MICSAKERETSIPFLRKGERKIQNYRLVSLTCVPWNIMDQIILEDGLCHMQGNEMF